MENEILGGWLWLVGAALVFVLLLAARTKAQKDYYGSARFMKAWEVAKRRMF